MNRRCRSICVAKFSRVQECGKLPSSVLPRHCKLFDIYKEFLHNGRHEGVEEPRGLQSVDV